MGIRIWSDFIGTTCDLGISVFSESHKVCNVKLPIILIQTIIVFLQYDIEAFRRRSRCLNCNQLPITCDAIIGANKCSSLEPLFPWEKLSLIWSKLCPPLMLDSLILPPVIWVQIPPYDANCRNLIPLPTLPSKGSSAQLLNLCNNDYSGWIQNSSHLIGKYAFVVLKSLIGFFEQCFLNTVYKKSFTILYDLINTTSFSQSLWRPVKNL